MASGTDIAEIKAREILDSRGNPTIEVDVRSHRARSGRAAVPSGASTGVHEALELRDGDRETLWRQGRAQSSRQRQRQNRADARGLRCDSAGRPRRQLIELDGTENKAKLGANAMLGVSLAAAHAAAASENLPLYRYLNPDAHIMPVPMMNVLNGGSHADSSVDMQEFMIVPVGAPSMGDAVRMGAEVFHALAERAQEARAVHQRRRRGRFRAEPEEQRGADRSDSRSDREGRATNPATDVAIALDPASSEFFEDGGKYVFARSDKKARTADEMVNSTPTGSIAYPIVSIEDGLAEDDWAGWKTLTTRARRQDATGRRRSLCHQYQAARARHQRRHRQFDPHQGEPDRHADRDTRRDRDRARKAGYTSVISHRSGETEDTTIADLAVATGAGQIKTGSMSRGERTAKYNRLIRIAEELGSRAVYPGRVGVQARGGDVMAVLRLRR